MPNVIVLREIDSVTPNLYLLDSIQMHQQIGDNPCGIMFHHFHGPTHAQSQGSISAEDLCKIIESFGEGKIIPAQEWLELSVAGRLKPNDVCLTFDDNLRCQYDVALPVLKFYDLTAFWFVYTSVLDGKGDRLELYRHFRSAFPTMDDFYECFFAILKLMPLSKEAREKISSFRPETYLTDFPFYSDWDRKFRFVRDEVLGPKAFYDVMEKLIDETEWDREEAAQNLWMNEGCIKHLEDEGHIIGLHSHTHPTRLGELSLDEQRREYQANLDRLGKFLKVRPRSMSHPCNSYNQETLGALRELGIQLGFCSNMRKRENPLSLEFPREDHANIAKRILSP